MDEEAKKILETVDPANIAMYDLYVLLMESCEELVQIREMVVALPKTYAVWDDKETITVQGEQTK
jgi:hypothetical protein